MTKLRYTIDEAAEIMSIARTRVYLMIREGEIPVSRFGRDVGILHSDIVAVLERSRELRATADGTRKQSRPLRPKTPA
jgi:excisionase family DNA binding protein